MASRTRPRCLECEVVEPEGGDEADDPLRCKLRNLGETMWRRDFGVGEPVEPAGDAGEGPIPEHMRKRFRVNPGVTEFDATHGAINRP